MFRIRRQRHKEPLAKQTQFTKQRNLYRTNMFIGLFKSGRTTINSSLICVKNVQKVFMQKTLMALNKVNINVDWEMELKKKKSTAILQSLLQRQSGYSWNVNEKTQIYAAHLPRIILHAEVSSNIQTCTTPLLLILAKSQLCNICISIQKNLSTSRKLPSAQQTLEE